MNDLDLALGFLRRALAMRSGTSETELGSWYDDASAFVRKFDTEHRHQFNRFGKCKCGEEGQPHHDGDFSYLCGSDYCRCSS